MTSYFDHDAIAEIIEAGRLRQASSDQIADDVVQRLQQGGWASAVAHPIRAGILRLLRQRSDQPGARR